MKFALISQLDVVADGYRIAQVEVQPFEIAPPFYWVEVSDDVVADQFYWKDNSALPIPQAEPVELPYVVSRVTPLQFFDRFTEAEQLAVVTATMSVPQVKLWYDKLIAATEVVFADPRLSAGLDALVAAGLLTQARSEEILPLNVRSSGVPSL